MEGALSGYRNGGRTGTGRVYGCRTDSLHRWGGREKQTRLDTQGAPQKEWCRSSTTLGYTRAYLVANVRGLRYLGLGFNDTGTTVVYVTMRTRQARWNKIESASPGWDIRGAEEISQGS